MGIDLRLPLGGMFCLFGVILAAYGLVSDPAIYRRSLGIDVNLWWGVAMIVFGGLMLLWSRFDRSAPGRDGPKPPAEG